MDYAIPDCNMPFEDYILACLDYIRTNRPSHDATAFEKIVLANSPFEFNPPKEKNTRSVGLLFIHGLLDSPFTLRDLANQFFENNMLCRSVLLPGHGTKPEDLMRVTYRDWIQVVEYGIMSLSKQVEKIVIVGYSTGATLALYHAMKHRNITGIILIAPAIRVKFPIDPLIHLLPYLTFTKASTLWLKKENEIDYAKYRSIPYHAVCQISELTKGFLSKAQLTCPMYVVVSRDDETISTDAAISLFNENQHQNSKCLIYTTHPKEQTDIRIIEHNSCLPKQHIDHFSHRSLPFSPTNSHYGMTGDYSRASHRESGKRYGAYISFLGQYYDLLHRLHLSSDIRQELTYNPDFDFMSGELISFVNNIATS